MNWLDMHTVMFSHVITDLLGLVVIFFLWRQNRGRFSGLSQWVVGFGLQMLGTLLIVARGAIPEWVSIILGNTIIIAGLSTTVDGLRRFGGRIRSRIPDFVLLGILAAVLFHFGQIRPNLAARTYAMTAALLMIFIDGAIVGFRRLPSGAKRIASRAGVGFVFLALFSVIRIFALAARPPENPDFFKAGLFETLFLLAYQALFIFMTYSLALAVNERLIGEIGLQEEKFAKAFRSSPYGISLTDVETGRIFDVNDGFIDVLDFSRDEAMGKTTLDLKIWEQEEDRRRAFAELAAKGKIRNMEFRFRKKSGEIITGLWSAEQIMINNRACVFSSINNISPRKRAQEGLLQTLQQKELLMRELKHRVKNSLNVVSSLLGLSREAATDPGFRAVLSDLRARIGSVSSVYEQLDRTGRVDTIKLRGYIQNLADSLAQSYGPTDGRIRVTTLLEDLDLETKRALPLGLMLNELLINGFKYAYPEGMSGEIRIELKSAAGGMRLIVSDDGVGKKAGSIAAESGGSGASLIEMLADQIGARVAYPPGPGMAAVIVF